MFCQIFNCHKHANWGTMGVSERNFLKITLEMLVTSGKGAGRSGPKFACSCSCVQVIFIVAEDDMGKIQQFEIAFDKNKDVYSPGESISGTVTLKVSQTLQCKGKSPPPAAAHLDGPKRPPRPTRK